MPDPKEMSEAMDWLYNGAEVANQLRDVMRLCREASAGTYVLKIGVNESGEVRLGYARISEDDPTAGGDEPQIMAF